ncbi:hypothetical protein, partial [Ruoffia sp. FAM 26255]|uniref:hypothetical protein n=1 Tax=Ruoffia sp. FAM 26255 TaxID=3259519 RepID=UPI0038868A7D
MDLFDWVELISKMRDEGYKGKDIADRLNWSAQNVSNYNNVFTRISTQVLEKAKHHQKGRVDNK